MYGIFVKADTALEPYQWRLFETQEAGQQTHRIMSVGGYIGDAYQWRVSTPIQQVCIEKDYYCVSTLSGSVYKLSFNNYTYSDQQSCVRNMNEQMKIYVKKDINNTD